MRNGVVLAVLLAVSGCGSGPALRSSGVASSVECAPFARQMSGIELYGDAAAWWDQADGRYRKSLVAEPGSVLVFKRSGRLPSGHVSVVSHVVSDREIRVTQANWVHHRITRDEPVTDVSAANDWSQVRVWWDPVRAMGITAYRTYGFILPRPDIPAGERLAGMNNP